MASQIHPEISESLVRRCQRCALRGACLPAGLSDRDLNILETRVRKTPVMQRGEYLYHAGEPASALYIVRVGSFKSLRMMEGGDERIVGLHIRGDLFGLDGLATGREPVDMVALEPSAVCVVPVEQIDRELKGLSGFCPSFMHLVGQEVAEQQTQQLLMESHSASERAARFLVRFAERLEDSEMVASSFTIPLTRRETANYLGLQLATLSRIFSRFRDEGILEVNRRHITILDNDRLHDAAGLNRTERLASS